MRVSSSTRRATPRPQRDATLCGTLRSRFDNETRRRIFKTNPRLSPRPPSTHERRASLTRAGLQAVELLVGQPDRHHTSPIGSRGRGLAPPDYPVSGGATCDATGETLDERFDICSARAHNLARNSADWSPSWSSAACGIKRNNIGCLAPNLQGARFWVALGSRQHHPRCRSCNSEGCSGAGLVATVSSKETVRHCGLQRQPQRGQTRASLPRRSRRRSHCDPSPVIVVPSSSSENVRIAEKGGQRGDLARHYAASL